ncbi:MAG: DUF4857 domain-containing protein [Odoribacter sp.]|nr:DUF4857 domain-containing protein [Odoribacter sp.]
MGYRIIVRNIIILFVVLAAAVLLPHIYRMMFRSSNYMQQISYSELLNDFVISEYEFKNIGKRQTMELVYHDTKGNYYTSKQADSLMPLDRVSQLVYSKTFPDTICGIAVSPKMVNDAAFRLYPRGSLNAGYGLYELKDQKLLLSKKWEATDLFRIKEKGIEFITSKTNTIDVEKSKIFNDELTAKGFIPPATNIWTPTSSSQMEQLGYIISDNNHTLFRLSMNEGKPDIQRLALPGNEQVRMINFMDKGNFLALITTEKGHAYLMFEDFSYQKLDLPDVREKPMVVNGNLLFRTFSIASSDSTALYVFDTNYNLINNYAVERPVDENLMKYIRVRECIFPLLVRQTPQSGIVFTFSPLKYFIWFNLILVLLAFFIKRKLGYHIKDIQTIGDLLLVLLFGIYGMIGIFLIPQPCKSKNAK